MFSEPTEPTFADILSSDKLTLEIARKIILAQQEQVSALQKTIEKLSEQNGKLSEQNEKLTE